MKIYHQNIHITGSPHQEHFSNSANDPSLSQDRQEITNESKKRKKSYINEMFVYKYYLIHDIKAAKRKYHIGFQRLQKIIQNHRIKIKPKRKTTVEMNDYIVELASSDRLALEISVEVQKRFQTFVSRQIVIRRLVENHFKYKKLFKVSELNDSQNHATI